MSSSLWFPGVGEVSPQDITCCVILAASWIGRQVKGREMRWQCLPEYTRSVWKSTWVMFERVHRKSLVEYTSNICESTPKVYGESTSAMFAKVHWKCLGKYFDNVCETTPAILTRVHQQCMGNDSGKVYQSTSADSGRVPRQWLREYTSNVWEVSKHGA